MSRCSQPRSAIHRESSVTWMAARIKKAPHPKRLCERRLTSLTTPPTSFICFRPELRDRTCSNGQRDLESSSRQTEGANLPMEMADLKHLIDTVRDELQSIPHQGKVADYIPELAKIDPKKFAISITDLKGETVSTGDDNEHFSIQSISKVFSLALALGKVGDGLWKRVGREPSGSAFNSIVQLEHERGIPRNPFINAGAIVVADILLAGVSRTSKTPTSIYLANRGYKTANIPIVPESPPPDALYNLKRPLVVGLTTGLDRLVQVRRNRLLSLNQAPETAYVDDERVKAEIAYARRMFADNGWPVIDVTRRSIEETAAAVIKLVEDRSAA